MMWRRFMVKIDPPVIPARNHSAASSGIWAQSGAKM